MITSKYFQEPEFKRCVPSCSLQDMDQAFMDDLDKVRELVGIPLVINCAFRSVEWEKAKGRSGTGDHPQRKGVDIRCQSDRNRWLIVDAAIRAGFNRIGIAKTFIHLGKGTGTPRVIWMY